ncbi:ORF20 [Fowl aviadenovirus A]|nr:ORF20 [Fowl aviadenovirus A]WNM87610.1 ORF20 [Fowl aviadenovirus A]WNM87649.1 ORF20 [Fowl aviadenovirus A]WNM88156.1 ORF20 [Fowl aviadenovirus A]WNM88390.1 ORF20 [Fowl aviadenovirus A]
MALCPLSESLTVSRACGFHNEVGVIWFSFLLRHDPTCRQEEMERLNEYRINRAVASLRCFDNDLMRRLHSSITVLVTVRSAKFVCFKRRDYVLMNCIVRIVSALHLNRAEKAALLHYLSRRLLFITPGMKYDLESWMLARRKTDFKFYTTGFLIAEKISVKMALRSMSFEVSFSQVPSSVPFVRSPVVLMNACRVTVTATIMVETISRSSAVTQPVCLRSMLRVMVSPELWPIVSQGLCYFPGYRRLSYANVEEWVFHVHGKYGEAHPECFGQCKQCSTRQPLSLFCSAQLAYLRNVFMERRARVAGERPHS